MRVTREHVVAALLALVVTAPPALARDGEPPPFLCGIWPDRVLFFDQETDTFSEELRLRYGAVTATAYTPDKSRVFVVTNRMQSVEVIDTARREVVDELTLSTPEERVWIHRVFPNASGTRVYLYVAVVRLEIDRLVYEEEENVVHYDLEADRVLERFQLPDEAMAVASRPNLHVSPDEETFYVIGDDILELDADSRAIVGRIPLGKPLYAGYGPLTGVELSPGSEPGVFYGIYRTRDPVQNKELSGVTRIDLYDGEVETFELGPRLRISRFALSADERRGYAGLSDLVVVDMEAKSVVRREEEFERGRTNNSMIVGHDGTKLYVSGVGDTMYVYDTSTLELLKTVFAGGDFMMPPLELGGPPPKN